MEDFSQFLTELMRSMPDGVSMGGDYRFQYKNPETSEKMYEILGDARLLYTLKALLGMDVLAEFEAREPLYDITAIDHIGINVKDKDKAPELLAKIETAAQEVYEHADEIRTGDESEVQNWVDETAAKYGWTPGNVPACDEPEDQEL